MCTALLLTVGACDSSTSNTEPAKTVVGIAAPLTGSLSRTGRDVRIGAEMALELANESRTEGAYSIRLYVEDTESTTAGTEAAFQNLVLPEGYMQ
ncbi:MAG: ABC transporter substrate-binding protein [Bacteroidetes bacterium]|nr:ABC transporter substrate-binding protein [Bacteroidota bacterium]